MAGSGVFCSTIYASITVTGPDGWPTVYGYSVSGCAPLALDLDRDGIEYRTQDNPIHADLDGDGRFSDYSWISPDDGLIVYDDNGDGIGQHHEWVLTTFVQGADTDLEALRAFDSDGNGVLNARDELWSKLKVGRDLDQNGRFDAGELKSFEAHGIQMVQLEKNVTAVSTRDAATETAPGVFTFSTGVFFKDGIAHRFADVALEKRAFAEHVYSDDNKSIVSYGAVHAWVHAGAAGAGFDLTRTYGGKTFADFFGGEGSDVVSGSAAANTISGGGGADRLSGEAGDDAVIADRADCYSGLVRGGEGFDALVLDAADPINFDVGGGGFEMASGGEGDDVLWTSTGTFGLPGVILLGAGGGDLLKGGEGDDVLIGGAGADRMVGFGGDDMFFIAAGDLVEDVIGGAHGMAGDTVFVEGEARYIFTGMYGQGIEHMHGGGGDDIIHASRTDAYFYQEKADNTLSGGAGNDVLFGGAGADIYLWQRGDGGDREDRFIDRNYGETEGDFVSLGEGVALADVSFVASGEELHLTIAGADGGRIVLRNFAYATGPADQLLCDGQFFNIRDLHARSQSAGGSVGLATMSSGSDGGTDSGTGGTGGGPNGGGDIPPVLIDLDGDGFDLIAPHKSGIFFDWDSDGIKDETGWAGPDDAFLVLDRDGDGAITRMDEISFGLVQGKKDPFVTDLQGLAAFDTNGNGSLDAGDADFARFGVWRDADSDAVVDAGELRSVAEVGLAALSLAGYKTGAGFNGNDNVVFATTDAVFEDGAVVKVADLFLGYDGSLREAALAGPGFGAHIA